MIYLVVFLPAIFACKHELKGNENAFEILNTYSKYCIYINFVMLLVLFILGRGKVYFDEMGTVRYYIIYIIGSCILANLLPEVVSYCKKNFKISFKRNSK